MKSGGVGGRRLWVAVEGRRKCCLIERGLDRGVTPGTLETRGASDAQVCHRSRQVAHTAPHTHTAEDMVSSVQGGWQGR